MATNGDTEVIDTTRREAAMPSAPLARAIVERVKAIGAEPYARSKEIRFLVTADALGRGEIFELDRALRNSRAYPSISFKRNKPVIADFEEFAASQEDRLDWRFWNVGTTGGKVAPNDLKPGLKLFNAEINQHFTELRKAKVFEPLLITIHLRFDNSTEMFDLHAHFVCKVSDENLARVTNYLQLHFSRTWKSRNTSNPWGGLPPGPVDNPGACATYALSGIIDHAAMVEWPEEAFGAVWSLCLTRAHLMRTGGAFAEWRKAKAATEDLTRAIERRRREERRENRRATRYEERTLDGARAVRRIPYPINGTMRHCVLYVKPATREAEAASATEPPPKEDSPSASVSTIQESTTQAPNPAPAILGRTKQVRKPRAWWPRAWPYLPATPSLIRFRPIPRPIARRLARCGAPPVENMRRCRRWVAGSMRP